MIHECSKVLVVCSEVVKWAQGGGVLKMLEGCLKVCKGCLKGASRRLKGPL